MKIKHLYQVKSFVIIRKLVFGISFLTLTGNYLFSQSVSTPVIVDGRYLEAVNNKEFSQVLYEYKLSDDSAKDDKKSVIVQFRGEALVILFNKGLDKTELRNQIISVRAQQAAQFVTFRKDLDRLYKTGYTLKGKQHSYFMKPETGQQYYRTYFGQQVTIDSLMIEEIEKLPYVIAVYPDILVKATLDESVHQINADSLWNELGSEGDSVRVGIIDTGIDYNHPDLGGGFGPGYKVVGGYDFVNTDNDPMDDNSHGTHVSGIVAADGTLRGVAPKALLYALKVLNKDGEGWESDIISAIEYTVDPNDDDDFSDMLDVANMSLGAPAWVSEDDPMVDAVEAAISLGVTFCIAAGNSAGTIDTPGTSPSAITVGAVDKEDSIAYFSGTGPSPLTNLFKPDIVAPGVDINSTVPGGDYQHYSGTSMATPHITGVCALLKKLHPEWGPNELKAAIMITARDIGKEKIVQGSGVVNAYRAAIANTLVDLPTVYFGLDSIRKDQVWIETKSVKIKNISGEAQNYSLEPWNTGTGITFTFSQENFSLDPGMEISIDVTVAVDNLILGNSAVNRSIMHSGDFLLKNSQQSFHINYAFNRATNLNLSVSGYFWRLYIFNSEFEYSYYYLPESILLKPDNYYLVAEFYETLNEPWIFTRKTVIKKVNMESSVNLLLDEAEAKNKIVFSTEDESGNAYSGKLAKDRGIGIALNDSVIFDSHKYSENELQLAYLMAGSRFNYGIGKICITSYNNAYVTNEKDFRYMDTVYFSDLPEGASFILGETRRNKLSGYHFCFNNAGPFNELGSNTILTSDAASYKTLFIKEPEPDKDHSWWPKLFYKTSRITDLIFISVSPRDNDMPLFAVSMPSVEDTQDDFYYYFTIKREHDFYTNPLKCIDNHFIFGKGDTPGAFTIEPDDTITYSKGPWTTMIQSFNNREPSVFHTGKSIEMYFNDLSGGFNEFFLDGQAEWTLYNEQGTKIESGDGQWINSDPIPDKYHANIVVNPHASSYSLPMSNTIDTWFDLRLDDPNPPTLMSFHTLDPEGNQVQAINKNDTATLLFTAVDEESGDNFEPGGLPVVFDSIAVFAKKHSETEWLKLEVDSLGHDSRDGLSCRSVVTATNYDSTHIDVKIICVDDVGNRTETVISPAFYVKNIQPPVAVDDIYSLSTNQRFNSADSDPTITANDIDPFGRPENLEIEQISDVSHGTLTLNTSSGSFKYNPEQDYSGTDVFTYKVRNEKYASNIATVTLNILPDAIPEFRGDEGGNIMIYPNPANESLNIEFIRAASMETTISVYDITGTKITDIAYVLNGSDRYTVTWDLRDGKQKRLNPGIYFISFQGNSLNEIHKVVIE